MNIELGPTHAPPTVTPGSNPNSNSAGTGKWLIWIVPVGDLGTEGIVDGGGVLSVLQPTLSSQLLSILTLFSLPSPIGLSLHLELPNVNPDPTTSSRRNAESTTSETRTGSDASEPSERISNANAPPLSPRVSEDLWPVLFSPYFSSRPSQHATTSLVQSHSTLSSTHPKPHISTSPPLNASPPLLPIAAKLLIHASSLRARWLPLWIRQARAGELVDPVEAEAVRAGTRFRTIGLGGSVGGGIPVPRKRPSVVNLAEKAIVTSGAQAGSRIGAYGRGEKGGEGEQAPFRRGGRKRLTLGTAIGGGLGLRGKDWEQTGGNLGSLPRETAKVEREGRPGIVRAATEPLDTQTKEPVVEMARQMTADSDLTLVSTPQDQLGNHSIVSRPVESIVKEPVTTADGIVPLKSLDDDEGGGGAAVKHAEWMAGGAPKRKSSLNIMRKSDRAGGVASATSHKVSFESGSGSGSSLELQGQVVSSQTLDDATARRGSGDTSNDTHGSEPFIYETSPPGSPERDPDVAQDLAMLTPGPVRSPSSNGYGAFLGPPTPESTSPLSPIGLVSIAQRRDTRNSPRITPTFVLPAAEPKVVIVIPCTPDTMPSTATRSDTSPATSTTQTDLTFRTPLTSMPPVNAPDGALSKQSPTSGNARLKERNVSSSSVNSTRSTEGSTIATMRAHPRAEQTPTVEVANMAPPDVPDKPTPPPVSRSGLSSSSIQAASAIPRPTASKRWSLSKRKSMDMPPLAIVIPPVRAIPIIRAEPGNEEDSARPSLTKRASVPPSPSRRSDSVTSMAAAKIITQQAGIMRSASVSRKDSRTSSLVPAIPPQEVLPKSRSKHRISRSPVPPMPPLSESNGTMATPAMTADEMSNDTHESLISIGVPRRSVSERFAMGSDLTRSRHHEHSRSDEGIVIAFGKGFPAPPARPLKRAMSKVGNSSGGVNQSMPLNSSLSTDSKLASRSSKTTERKKVAFGDKDNRRMSFSFPKSLGRAFGRAS